MYWRNEVKKSGTRPDLTGRAESEPVLDREQESAGLTGMRGWRRFPVFSLHLPARHTKPAYQHFLCRFDEAG